MNVAQIKLNNELNNSNRRTQLRIQVQIPVEVTFPGAYHSITVLNQDLSWGGALLIIPHTLPEPASPLRMVLPWRNNKQIITEAEVIRSKSLADGYYLVAVRFSRIEPANQARLEKLLEMLRNTKAELADQTTEVVTQEITLQAQDDQQLRQILLQITAGQYLVQVHENYVLNQSVRVIIRSTPNLPASFLRARVIAIRETRPIQDNQENSYILTLSFEHSRKSIRALVKLLLNQLPEVVAPANISTAQIAVTSTTHIPVKARNLGLPSILELQVPEAVNYLTAGWGDAEAFHIIFHKLVLGNQVQLEGWSPDIWAELDFLQKIHDRAYGLPVARKYNLAISNMV